MAKRLTNLSIFLSVAIVLVLVYFFRPKTFSFLMEGFADADEFDPDPEGFKGAAGKKDTNTAATPPAAPKCVPGCVP